VPALSSGHHTSLHGQLYAVSPAMVKPVGRATRILPVLARIGNLGVNSCSSPVPLVKTYVGIEAARPSSPTRRRDI